MTAYVNDTAADYDDLWTKFTTEITSNAALTNANEQWVQAWNVGDEFVFKGPGLAGSDSIYVGIRKEKDAANTKYAWWIYGMTGVNASATSILGHVNVSPPVKLLLDDAQMEFWLAVSGRRWAIVVKVSTYYEAAYGGFFLPFLTPSEYPYPMFIGGSSGTEDLSKDPDRWNDATDGHRNYVDPWHRPYYSVSGAAVVRAPDGTWGHISNYDDDGPYYMWPTMNGRRLWDGYPWYGDETDMGPTSNVVVAKARQNLGGGYPGWPYHIVASDGSKTLGVLDGIYRIPNYQVPAETTLTVDGETCMAYPNVWRQDATDMWAMRLS